MRKNLLFVVALCAATMVNAGMPTFELKDFTENLIAEQTETPAPVFKAPAEEDWGEWQPFAPAGDSGAVFTFSTIFSGTDTIPGVRVRYDANSSAAQVWVPNWGKGVVSTTGVDFIFNWDTLTNVCRVPAQSIGYLIQGTGYIYVMDMGVYVGEKYFSSYPCRYDPTKGVFNMNLGYTLQTYIGSGKGYGYGNETLEMNGYKDFSAKLYIYSMKESEGKANYQVYATSKSCTKFRYGITSNVTSEAELISFAQGLKGDFTNLTEVLGQVQSGTGEGFYYIVVASYDDDEVYNSCDYAATFFSPSSKWTVKDSVNYTDDIIASYYSSLSNATYKLEIQENNQYAGLFRLKNPYGKAFPYSQYASLLVEDAYLYINATNPNSVSLNYPSTYQSLGIDLGMGMNRIKHVNTGTYADRKITFPTNGIAIYIGNNGYYANTSGKFCIEFLENPATRVDEVATEGAMVTKKMYNGRLVIERNGVKYDAQGAVVK